MTLSRPSRLNLVISNPWFSGDLILTMVPSLQRLSARMNLVLALFTPPLHRRVLHGQ